MKSTPAELFDVDLPTLEFEAPEVDEFTEIRFEVVLTTRLTQQTASGRVLVLPPTACEVETLSSDNSLDLDPYYEKYCPAEPIAIVAPGEVDSFTLHFAEYTMDRMLADFPSFVGEALSDQRLHISPKHELVNVLPELEDYDGPAAGVFYWTFFVANGIGILNRQKSDLVHELGHAIHLSAYNNEFDQELFEIYQRALTAGFWAGAYAETNHLEYWAEGVTYWFAFNRANTTPQRCILLEKDPELYAFIESHVSSTPIDCSEYN